MIAGLQTIERVIALPRGALRLLLPADPDQLLACPETLRRFGENEYMPYWAELWPAAIALAEVVQNEPVTGSGYALEIGCGVGLAGLAAASAGWRCTLTDYDEAALAFARENARRNGLSAVRVRALDWSEPHTPGLFERVLAADVLYESRNHVPVMRCLQRRLAPGGVGLIADPFRTTADAFAEMASGDGWICTQQNCVLTGAAFTPQSIRVFRLRRRF